MERRGFPQYFDANGGSIFVKGRSAVVTLRGDIPEPGSAPRGEGGFTFVELAIAVLIVGILSAIAVPAYREYLQKNKEATAISDIQIIALRLAGYRMEGILPAGLTQINFGNTLPLIDPWGNPYKYLPIFGHPENLHDVRKDHNLHPINTDFDLYSMGSDGQSMLPLTNQKSRDDIIRANDGAFIGKASTYDP